MSAKVLLLLAAALLFVPQVSWALGGENKSGLSPSKLSLPKGPGSLGGVGENVETDFNMGLMSYRVPIELPTGYPTLTPQLALTYSSGAGNSEVGIGWSLNLPSVERMTSRGLPSYQVTDSFAANGTEELVRVSDDGYYRARHERGFIRYQWLDDDQGVGGYWKAEYPDGRAAYFGADAEGRVVESARVHGYGGVYRYHVVEVVDPFGHRLVYSYDKDEEDVRVSGIEYVFSQDVARYRVEFHYEARPDWLTDGKSGALIRSTRRLSSITTRVRGEQLRRYELQYEPDNVSGGLSRLATVRWYGLNDEGPYPIQFRFGYSAGLDHSRARVEVFDAALGVDLAAGTADLVDLNADNLPDVLDTAAGQHRVFLNSRLQSGRHTFETARDLEVGGLELTSPSTEMFDVDGDGRSDLVDAQTRTVLWNRGTGAWQREELLDRLDLPDLATDANLRFLDYNNDKRIDLLHADPGATWVIENRGGGAFEVVDEVEPVEAGFVEDALLIADMNGDGLHDLVRRATGLVSYRANLGFARWSPWIEMDGVPADVPTAQFVDLNGDGLSDCVSVLGDSLQYSINRDGTRFVNAVTLRSSDDLELPERFSDVSVRFADMNGSGSTDVVWVDASGQVSFLEVFPTRPNLLVSIDNSIGKVISVSYGSSTDHLLRDDRDWSLRLPHPMLVVDEVSVLDELSGKEDRTVIEYRNGYYDGQEKQFRGFRDVMVTMQGDASTDTAVRKLSYDVGQDDAYRKGLLLEEQVVGSFGSLETTAHEFDDCEVAAVPETEPAVRFVCATGSRRIVQEELSEPNWVTIEQKTRYDGYGNAVLTESLGVVAIGGGGCTPCREDAPAIPCGDTCGGDEWYVESAFIEPEEGGPWIIGKASSVREYGEKGLTTVRERRYYYDGAAFTGEPAGKLSHGALSRVTGRVDGSTTIDLERHERNSHGAVLASMDPDGRMRRFLYDADGLLITREAIVLDDYTLETRVQYDSVLDLIDWATDWVRSDGAGESDEAVTRYAYDAFGRVTAMARPGDTLSSPSEVYQYHLAAPLSRIVRQSRSESNQDLDLEEVQCFDGLGRPTQTRTLIEPGRYQVSGFEAYNGRGQVFRSHQAYSSASADCDETPPADAVAAESWFDAMGRTLVIQQPDAGLYDAPLAARTVYEPLRTITYDEEDTAPKGANAPHADTPLIVYNDGLGRTVAVERFLTPEQTLRSDVFYNVATGEAEGYRDAAGNVKRQVFDLLGRVLRVEDPDTGTSHFSYDGSGNALSKTDALGVTVRARYDAAGRRVAEWQEGHEESTRVAYTYDTPVQCDGCAFLAGKTASVSYPLDDKGEEWGMDEFGHNLRGEPVYVSRALAGKRFEFLSEFDNVGRIRQAHYPAELSVRFEHDGVGRLTRAGPYVPQVDYDAAGRVTALRLGNGVVSAYDYDVLNRLTTIETASAELEPIQSTRFTRDRVGNIVAVAEEAVAEGEPSLNARYRYDALYRLVHAELDPGRPLEETLSFEYDSIDNLIYKASSWGDRSPDHVGTYSYGHDGAGPHTLGSAGNLTFEHDAAGRVVRRKTGADRAQQRLRWDYLGRLQGVDDSEFTYGPTHDRVVKTENGETTYYLTPDFELRDAAAVLYVRVGDVRVAKIEAPQVDSQLLPDLAPAKLHDDRVVPEPDGQLTASDAWVTQLLSSSAWELEGEATAPDAAVVPQLLAASARRLLGGFEPDELRVTYLHHDHLNNVIAVTDSDGRLLERRAHYPFGLNRDGSTSIETGYSFTDYAFTDKETDRGSGLIYSGARYLDPIAAVWTAPDPAFALVDGDGFAGRLPEYQNRYGYAHYNPIVLQDSDGRLVNLGLAAIGAAIGGAVGGVAYAVTADEFSGRALLSAVAGGAVSGGLAGLTGGASLAVQAAGATAGGVAGGVVSRGIATGDATAALDPKAMARDGAFGAVGLGLGKVVGSGVDAALRRTRSVFGSGAKPSCTGPGCCFEASTPVVVGEQRVPISQVELGMLAGEVNADCALLPRDGWQRFRLLLFDDASDAEFDVELLRTAGWAPTELSLEPGVQFDLSFGDLGRQWSMSGRVVVLEIADAPPLPYGERCPVTGTFRHVEQELLELTVEGTNEPLRLTAGHPLFSEDAHDWVRAGELKPGETLRTAQGNTRVVDVQRVLGAVEVYNLEVAVAHTYFVGELGIWTHNMCEVVGVNGLRTALKTASGAYKGSTLLGHALSKHAGRNPNIWGKVKGNPGTWHSQGLQHFREIVRGPGSFQWVTNSKGTTFLEKMLPDGRGVRLQLDHTFKGFID